MKPTIPFILFIISVLPLSAQTHIVVPIRDSTVNITKTISDSINTVNSIRIDTLKSNPQSNPRFSATLPPFTNPLIKPSLAPFSRKIVRNQRFVKTVSSDAFQILHISLPLIVLGSVTYNEKDFKSLRTSFIPTFRYHYDDYLQYAPAAVMLGLKAAGVKGRSSWGRMLVSDAFSIAIMTGTVNLLKYTVKEGRPDGSASNSFPSGHTATAFMTATMLHKEYGLTRSPLYSVGAYAAATAVALSRQMNNKHWISDVLVGSGIGILSTNLGYYLADLIFKDKGIIRDELDFDSKPHGNRPSFLELKVGYCITPSEMAFSKGVTLNPKLGTTVGLSGAWFFHKNIGFGVEASVKQSPLSIDKDHFYRSNPQFEGYDVLVECKPVEALNLSAGPHFSMPLGFRWYAETRLTGGWGIVKANEGRLMTRPGNSEEATPYNIVATQAMPKITGGNMGVGVSFMRMTNRNMGLTVFFDYNSYIPSSKGVNINVKQVSMISFGMSIKALFFDKYKDQTKAKKKAEKNKK